MSGDRRFALLLAALAAGALALRLFGLEDLALWFDETAVFDRRVWGDPPVPALEFARDVEAKTTYSAGWPLFVWLSARLFGGTAAAARALPAACGAAAVVAVGLLARRLGGAVAGVAAAAFVALSATQIDFSQRLYPYAAVPLFAALVALLHLGLLQAIDAEPMRAAVLARRGAAYALLGALAIFVHASLVLVVAASAAALALRGLARVRGLDAAGRRALVATALGIGLVAGATLLLNLKDPKSGYRYYLHPYYHPPDLGAVRFLALRAYDVLTYNLNLFYGERLYWPRALNASLLPLVLAALAGWAAALSNRWMRPACQVGLVALGLVVLPAALSLVRRYPFGGVRQCLFLSPFLACFLGLAVASLWKRRLGRAAVVVGGAAYLAAWTAQIAHFYEERAWRFTPAELAAEWEAAGEGEILVDGGTWHALDYYLRGRPEIRVRKVPPELPPPPYLVASPHWPIEESPWRPDLVDAIARSGGAARLVLAIPAQYPLRESYRESIYHPPNGLWLYAVEAAGDAR